jgi:hypothetical protein
VKRSLKHKWNCPLCEAHRDIPITKLIGISNIIITRYEVRILIVRCDNMNPKFFGDSYDLAKRFFCGALAALDYDVIIDPMFTGEWNGKEKSNLLGQDRPQRHQSVPAIRLYF